MMKEEFRQAFARAAAKPEGLSSIDFLEAILRERPDLRGQPYEFAKQGANGYNLFIGDEVFKGPKYAVYLPMFDREHEILKQLEGSGLPVPKVTCVGRESFFFGMRRMPGVILGAGFCDRLTPADLRIIAKDMARFVIDMGRALPAPEGQFMFHHDLMGDNIWGWYRLV